MSRLTDKQSLFLKTNPDLSPKEKAVGMWRIKKQDKETEYLKETELEKSNFRKSKYFVQDKFPLWAGLILFANLLLLIIIARLLLPSDIFFDYSFIKNPIILTIVVYLGGNISFYKSTFNKEEVSTETNSLVVSILIIVAINLLFMPYLEITTKVRAEGLMYHFMISSLLCSVSIYLYFRLKRITY
mgnify:CR=1 FL=1